MFPTTTKILIVDDMTTMRKLVEKALKDMGFTEVREAKDGIKGWEVVQTGKIDLIVSDSNMPGSTGLDLLKRVRADHRFAKIPFILLGAEGDKSEVIEALKAGVDGYIVKPFTADQVRAKLDEIYKKKAAA